MANIVYKLDPEVILGQDTLNRAGSAVSALGGRVLVAAGQTLYENNAIERLISILEAAGVEAILFDAIHAQAVSDTARSAAELARAARPDKMARLASIMGEPVEGASAGEAAGMAVDFARRYMGKLQLPARLKEFGLSLDKLAPAAEAARNLEFAAFSPWTVSSGAAFDVLKQAF